MAFYVNMTDRFMSGWGLAPRRSYLCIACETLEQAEAIERAAKDRSEMRYVTIAAKPRRGRAGDHVSVKDFAEMGGPWLRYWRGPHAKAETRDA